MVKSVEHSVGMADFQVPISYLSRDALFLMAMVVGVVVFMTLRKPFPEKSELRVRKSDGTDRRQNRVTALSPEVFLYLNPSSNWDCCESFMKFSFASDEDLLIWRITLFSAVKVLKESFFKKTENDFFEIASFASDTDRVLAPLVRKVILKYKSVFETEAPIQVSRTPTTDVLLTWLPNESCLRRAVFEFLDEAVAIAKIAGVPAQLKIVWGNEFRAEVIWPKVAELEILYSIEMSEDEVEIYTDGKVIAMAIWLGFSKINIPRKLAEREAFKESRQRSA